MSGLATEDVGLSIRRASELLGVPAATLRSWEGRYGVPDLPRSSGGHRRYSAEALHQLRLMRDQIALGRRAADAARTVRSMLDPAAPGGRHVADLLAASDQMDPAGVREVLDSAHRELGLAATVDDVLMPAMRQVGNWWQTGRCDVAQEHITTDAVRGWLARLTTIAPVETSNGTVLLACGPRDLHTLGLEGLSALLTAQGLACRVLGARTPSSAIGSAIAATDADAVVLVSHLPTHRRAAVEDLIALSGTGCALFYAGNAFLFPASRRGVPGTYLGESLGEAADLIRSVCGSADPSPR